MTPVVEEHVVRIEEGAKARLICDIETMKIWDFYARLDKVPLLPHRSGQFMICAQVIEGMQMWVVANIWLTWPLRGHGIMRQFIRLVRSRYPNLCSDLTGTTSAEAVKMWKAMGAERLDTRLCPNGYIYLLR